MPAARLAVAGLLLALTLAACGSTGASDSQVALRPFPGVSAAAGMAHATGEVTVGQHGDQISGSVQVGGLVPGSRHAWVIQGPLGGCAPIDQPANLAVLLHDFVANGQGSATMGFAAIAHEQVVSRGYDVAVYLQPKAPITPLMKSDPMVLCGDLG